jgi:hypothetical protein
LIRLAHFTHRVIRCEYAFLSRCVNVWKGFTHKYILCEGVNKIWSRLNVRAEDAVSLGVALSLGDPACQCITFGVERGGKRPIEE